MCPAPCPAGSTVSYAGVAHFPKQSLEYSLNFWSQSKKKNLGGHCPPSPLHSYGGGCELTSMSRGTVPMHSQQPPGVVQNWSTLQCSKQNTEQCGYDHAPVTRGRMRAQFPLPHGPLHSYESRRRTNIHPVRTHSRTPDLHQQQRSQLGGESSSGGTGLLISG